MPTHDFISRAARFFVLAEQSSRLSLSSAKVFWDLSASFPAETVTHLPAMMAAVRRGYRPDIFRRVSSHPLPAVFPPEAVPWHNQLVAAWEGYCASSQALLQNLARLALVRLDSCGMPDGHERPSRLPEWLAEAQKIASGEWRVVNGKWRAARVRGERKGRPASRNIRDWDNYWELQRLAALAAWHPAPQVITPPETLREWVNFWLKRRQSEDPVEKGIAAIALLNLPEVDLRAASIPPIPAGELLQQLSTAIRVAAERINPNYLFLLDWQPAKESIWPVAELRNVVQSWLESTRHEDWLNRRAAWRQLIRWDMAGSLAICGMDLLPELVNAVPTENDASVLRELTRWAPAAQYFTSTGTPDSLSQLQQLESAWERYRGSRNSWDRESAWLAGIRLHQAGLVSGSQESFLNAYISTVADTSDPLVLFILAQWSPGAEVPGMRRAWNAAWQQRLLQEREFIPQIATGALLRQLLEQEHGRSLRGVALELWRAGVKVSPEARHILGAAFARFQEVRARLAAGEVPDFEGKMFLPAERCRLPLALPPGRIAGGEWQMENKKLNMENGESRMKHQEATPQPNPRLVPGRPSRSGMSE